MSLIAEYEPSARIIAEEGGVRLDEGSAASGRVWVIDPIDGTAQFVTPEGREFCSVVTVLSDGSPDACYVLAPELGEGRSPVVITLDGDGALPRVNGEPARAASVGGLPRSIGDAERKPTSARIRGGGGAARVTAEDPYNVADPRHRPDVPGCHIRLLPSRCRD